MTALLLIPLLVLPAVCFALVLPGLDPLGRSMVGAAGSLCLLTLVAQLMIIFHVWSPGGGAVVVALICAAMLGAAYLRRPVHEAAVVAAATAHENEDWLFDE
ncbi:MAG: hypothetical protein ABIS86_23555 [Streptosporangiaceae bacterium]